MSEASGLEPFVRQRCLGRLVGICEHDERAAAEIQAANGKTGKHLCIVPVRQPGRRLGDSPHEDHGGFSDRIIVAGEMQSVRRLT